MTSAILMLLAFNSRNEDPGAMPKFKLLPGGKAEHMLNGVHITVALDTERSLPVDVRVFEEDTHLVLTVDPVMRYTEEHPVRLLNDLARSKTGKPGSIVVNGASWYAVIHDLDAAITSRPEWVAAAYRELIALTRKDDIRRIGVPLLGSVHGTMTYAQSLELLLCEINSAPSCFTKELVILAEKKYLQSIVTLLKKSI